VRAYRNGAPTKRGVVGLVLVAFVALIAATAGTGYADSTWPTYHGSVARTGVDASDNLSGLAPAWNAQLDGAAVYGQPVVADGRVFVATEDNDVYALDAHDGHVLWSHSIGLPLTNVDRFAGCGDVDPLGITSTPVIDTASGVLYVVGEVSNGASSPTVHHQLVGFNLYTGAEVRSVAADPPIPAGESSINLLQRAALALGNGRVYVGYGGNDGDCGNYHGWLVGVDETGARPSVSFEVASQPGGQGGAIWEAGGPAIDAAGNVYVTTGNANPDPPQGGPDPGLYTESVVKLGPNLGAPLAAFKDAVAGGDEDLGTDAPTLIPGSTPSDGTVFSVGKTDIGYVLSQSNLSRVAAIGGVCGSNPDGGNAYDAALGTLYVPCRGGGLQEVNLSSDTLGWHLGTVNGAPILVGGALWALQYTSGLLQELNPATGAIEQQFNVGSVPTFASPSAALGLLLIGTSSGVKAYHGPAGVPAPAPPIPGQGAGSVGYDLVTSAGAVYNHGSAPYEGAVTGALNAPIRAATTDPATNGYWMIGTDGGVFSFGAPFFGSTGSLRLNAPIVGMAAAPNGRGYWLVASDGGVFTFGDIGFFGSAGGIHLNAPIVGMAVTPDGGGYWLVASDGGVFSFGDARFLGSEGAHRLNAPIVGVAGAHNGQGYWLVASDGGIFSFGAAHFSGSLGSLRLNAPIVGMASAGGNGYWLTAGDGGVFSFGAPFLGSQGGEHLDAPVVAITATAQRA